MAYTTNATERDSHATNKKIDFFESCSKFKDRG